MKSADFDDPAVVCFVKRVDFGILERHDSGLAGLAKEERVDVGTEPLSVRDVVARTCGRQEFVGVVGLWLERFSGFVFEVAEASFTTGGDVRVGRFPGAVFCERFQPVEIVLVGEARQDQAGGGGG